MRLVVVVCLLLLSLASLAAASLPIYSPTPNPSNVVAARSRVRLTLLSNCLVRAQLQSNTHGGGGDTYDDRASFAVIHRNTPTVAFNVTNVSGVVVVETSCLRVRVLRDVRADEHAFASDVLSVTWKDEVGGGGDLGTWKPGMVDDKNLGGSVGILFFLFSFFFFFLF